MVKNYFSFDFGCAHLGICTSKLGSFKKNYALSLLFLLFINFQLFAQTQTIILENDGIFTVPCGVTSIKVEAWGAGGSGGSRNSTGNAAGGGGGAYASSTFTVEPGSSFDYIIGKGGIVGEFNATGGDGGASIFGNSIVKADGGKGGNHGGSVGSIGGKGGYAINSVGDITFSGGNGGNGSMIQFLVNGVQNITNGVGGAGGGAAGPSGNGGNALAETPGVGSFDFGGNGAPGFNGVDNFAGLPGLNYGGGGSGSFRYNANRLRGGYGANGLIRITYTKVIMDYCAPTFTSGVRPITSVQINDLLNTSSQLTTSSATENFCNVVNVTQGATTNTLTVKANTNGNNTQYFIAYFDWNQNGVFGDAGETYTFSSGITNSSGIDALVTTTNISVPFTALTGLTKMRIISRSVNTFNPCITTAAFGQSEDYIVNVNQAAPCVAPVVQPNTLILSANATTVSGIFYEGTMATDNYLVVLSKTNTAPTLVNGTNYAIGYTFPGGQVVIDNDSNTNFTVNSGITANTTYYVFVYAYNSFCLGGPLYNKLNPLKNNINNTTPTYCTPNMSNNIADDFYFTKVSFIGIINETTNSSSYSTNPRGYQDFTGLAQFPIQEIGEGINISIQNNALAKVQAWVDWNKNGTFDTNERVYTSGGTSIISTTFGFIVPTTTAPGQYRLRLRMSTSTGTVNACTNSINGETEDYLFTVIAKCATKINSVTNGETCGEGPVVLAATGNAGTTVYSWYANETGGAPLHTSSSNTWTTPSLNATRTYWVTSGNGSCESKERKAVIAKISPLANISFYPENPVVCGENDSIMLTASGDTETVYLINEEFENGIGNFETGYAETVTTAFSNKNKFQIRTSPYVPDYTVWFPAISSGQAGNKFILCNSDFTHEYIPFNHYVRTPQLNSTNFSTLQLSLKLYFSRYKEDLVNPNVEFVDIQVSTNNTTWTTLERFSSDVGIGTRFKTLTYDVSNYVGQTNLRFRVLYNGAYTDGVAIDDVKVWGIKPLLTSFEWLNTTNVNAYIDSAATIRYVEGNRTTTLYVKPTYSQLQYETFQFTATARLTNGCIATKNIDVTNKTKIWNGTNLNWNSDANWLPYGKPTLDNCVIIPSEVQVSGSNYEAFGKNVTVKSTGKLTVKPTNNLIIKNWINVDSNGQATIEDKASLVQNENDANSGIVKIIKTTPPMFRLGLNYWSSPLTNNSNFKIGQLNPLTNYIYSYNPNVYSITGHFQPETGNTLMKSGSGYIVGVPTNFNMEESGLPRQTFTANFVGTPFNGLLQVPLYISTNAATINEDFHQINLVGNPYASAIDASRLILDARNANKTDGTVILWGNFSGISSDNESPYYNQYGMNYTSDDYIMMNIAGTVHNDTEDKITTYQYIASGQGFFVNATTNNSLLTFDNNMRVKNENSVFYKEQGGNAKDKIEQVWLNLKNDKATLAQALIGYAAFTTDGFDYGYDSKIFKLKKNQLYTMIPGYDLAIQTKPTFDSSDVIPLGFTVETAGKNTISVGKTKEWMNDTEIYLMDKKLNIAHNLKTGDYVFNSTEGDHRDRFELRFRKPDTKVQEPNKVFATTKDGVTIHSDNQNMSGLEVFDINGRLLFKADVINEKSFSIPNLDKIKRTYIINVRLENGKIENLKVIY